MTTLTKACQYIATTTTKIMTNKGMVHLIEDTLADLPIDSVESLLAGGFIKEHFNNKKED